VVAIVARIPTIVLVLGLFLWTGSVSAQSGMYVYPQKGQSPDQQDRDEYECYGWAKSQSGVDPSAPSGGANQGQRGRRTVGGAARGAGMGAAIGAIAGDAGKGAAAGAVVGGVGGRRRAKQEEQYSAAATRNSYDRAFAACMEGRGYTVR
jgi:hypothetical protein